MDQVQRMLGNQFVMLYHPALPVSALTPQQTLSASVDVVNSYMKSHGKDLSQWEPGMQDEAARLVNVNVIYQNLTHEPIRKPILVHAEKDCLIVDCGDTRLMALGLCLNPPKVSAILTVPTSQRDQYSDWQQISSDQELLDAVGMDHSTAGIYYTPSNCTEYAVSWLEVGDASTAHHLHSMDAKIKMLQDYLDQQCNNFKFSVPWIRTAITWTT